MTRKTKGRKGTRSGRRPAPSRMPFARGRIAALSALLVAVTVPAVAEPLDWVDLPARALGLAPEPAPLAPMPFETAQGNFPGSALYWTDIDQDLVYDLEDLRSEAAVQGDTIRFTEAVADGLAAPAFQNAGSSIDKARALQCLSMAIYYEAASESLDGQRAVAQVVLNRVAHPAYPASVCGVVFQGSERTTGCQFTFTCDGSLSRQPSRRSYATAQSVALSALSGTVFPDVGTATHYHTHAVNPYWASSLDLIGSIGAHRFYRWKGKAGRADAFSMAYRGGEPLAAPNRRSAGPAQASQAGISAAPPPPSQVFAPVNENASPAPAPAVDDKLPQSGQVKPEYERSGKWIRKPGS